MAQAMKHRKEGPGNQWVTDGAESVPAATGACCFTIRALCRRFSPQRDRARATQTAMVRKGVDGSSPSEGFPLNVALLRGVRSLWGRFGKGSRLRRGGVLGAQTTAATPTATGRRAGARSARSPGLSRRRSRVRVPSLPLAGRGPQDAGHVPDGSAAAAVASPRRPRVPRQRCQVSSRVKATHAAES